MKETPEKGSDKVTIHKFILVAVMLTATLLSGCSRQRPTPTVPDALITVIETTAAPDPVLAAYSSLLAGDLSPLEKTQPEKWWIPDFQDASIAYECTCIDLDGDGVMELLIQAAGDPASYNGVFHFTDGQLICWNSDAAEGSCRDYPLMDGTMVRQYDVNGTRTYTLFRYNSDGTTAEISNLFAREELLDETSADPCPYYEVSGTEVSKEAFDQKLDELITSRMHPSTAWTAIDRDSLEEPIA